MGALLLNIHSKTPEIRKIKKVVELLQSGGVVLYPTDTGFSLGCQLSNKSAIDKLRFIRRISEKKELTFLCGSLSNIAEFARVSNLAYKTIKRLIPGPYTFILPASKSVPRYAQNPFKKTAGIRVPDNILAQLLLKELHEPIIAISAKVDDEVIENEEDLLKKYIKLVDVAVSSDEYHFTGQSTIIDMTSDVFSILREGADYEKALQYISSEE